MANTNTDFAAFQQMRRINPSKYHNQKTRKTMNATYRDVGMAEFFGIDEDVIIRSAFFCFYKTVFHWNSTSIFFSHQ